MQEIMTYYILLYLACEQKVFIVRQIQRNNWVKQPNETWRTRVGQPMKELGT